ncbi:MULTISPECIES: carboxylesterase/lipase family protein [unclassified Leifsonia]|uniref:carboxylesterase/lipase family protein n=1 Tax=unclassified Leifsonia TaxID=2663824 RepID=UPI000377708A|nr:MULTISPECIES: carboxylesterase/lipase family protein [unclassified Leifsonia]TDP99297.1 para-nitrobenzyl esterase [Leifsonia sp. 115AMFTsu3.1]
MNGRPVVVTSAGAVRGRDDGRVSTWRGIRYGEPPTGRLRWRAPVPAAPWSGVVDAVAFGPAAPQRPNPAVPLGPPGETRMDEDCLFLNVIRPSYEPPSGGLRPVMVWLQGGAYALGASSQRIYRGDRFVPDGDVVLVTLNHRLGALGFLDVRSVGVDDAETNVALRDVLLALRWVRDNIHAFGGDPDSVTVFGQSAGAGLVTALLASPAAAGLFHRAIAQSPPAGSMYGPERAATVARAFVERLGPGARTPGVLRGVQVEAIVDAGAAVYTEIPREHPGMLAFAPVVGDDLLPEAPIRVLSDGRGMPVPLLIGSTHDEATLFRLMRSPLLPIRRTALRRMFDAMRSEQERGGASLPERERVLSAYGRRRPARGVRVATDIAFRMPALWVAAGHCAVAPTHLYRFDFAPPLLRITGVGASHATDLPYVWGEFDALPRDPSFLLGGRRTAEAVSERMRRRWADFARTGVPGTGWPTYEPHRRATLVIGATDRVVPDLDARLRAGWGEQVLTFG